MMCARCYVLPSFSTGQADKIPVLGMPVCRYRDAERIAERMALENLIGWPALQPAGCHERNLIGEAAGQRQVVDGRDYGDACL